MERSARWQPLAMVGAVLMVFALAYCDLDREQARALADFSAEQHALAAAKAASLENRIDGLVRVLGLAVAASQSEAIAATLERAVGDGALVRGAAAYARDGSPLVARGVAVDSIALAPVRRDIVRALVPGSVSVSAPLFPDGDDTQAVRIFAMATGDRVVVLVVDTDALLAGLVEPQRDPAASRVILRDGSGRWADIARRDEDTAFPDWRDERTARHEVADLLASMSEDEPGTVRLGPEAAVSLGLEPRLAIAGFAPVRAGDGPPWSLAVVASAMRLRDRAKVASWRLAATTTLATLIVAGFGFVFRRQQHRQMALTQALRLAETTAALRERSEKIVETIPVGIMALDHGSRVTSVNKWLAEHGVHAGASLSETLAFATPEERTSFVAVVDTARRTRTPAMRSDVSLHLEHDDARAMDMYVVPLERPLPDAECLVVVHDRTEIRRLENDLVRAEKLATIGTLAAGVAHEIGTPLGIISGRTEQLLTKATHDGDGEPTRKALASILGQVDKVSKTIRQLLDFARTRPIVPSEVGVDQLLHSIASLLEHRLGQAKVTLEVSVAVDTPPIAGDAGQLEQVMVNLVLNAIDACSPGGHVRATARTRSDVVLLEVVDDGYGIAPEHLGAVLDPFFTTKKRGQGTGLGLSVAADIVKNHGGTIRIDSTLGVGTSVVVSLPAAR